MPRKKKTAEIQIIFDNLKYATYIELKSIKEHIEKQMKTKKEEAIKEKEEEIEALKKELEKLKKE